jgi:hypothetical protein
VTISYRKVAPASGKGFLAVSELPTADRGEYKIAISFRNPSKYLEYSEQ